MTYNINETLESLLKNLNEATTWVRKYPQYQDTLAPVYDDAKRQIERAGYQLTYNVNIERYEATR